MAAGGETSDEIERGAGRMLRGGLMLLLSVGVIAAWVGTSGWYRLDPGEAAVVLRLGAYDRTVVTAGLHFKAPNPIESYETVRFGELRREKFGFEDSDRANLTGETAAGESGIQTADNNIVNMSYVVQFYVNDAFAFVYDMADPQATLRDAAESAMREIVGRHSGNEALRENRAGIQREAQELLQARVNSYFPSVEAAAFRIDRIEIQDSKAPAPVQSAFDDVVSAGQDEERSQAEARGDAREIVERAQAEAQELREAAEAYRDAKLVEAGGEAARFTLLLAEYKLAPEVTRQRLYLETMEEILPGMDKVIIEPDTVSLMPYMPLGSKGPGVSERPSSAAGPGVPVQGGVQ